MQLIVSIKQCESERGVRQKLVNTEQKTEMIYFVDQDKIWQHNTFTRIHSDYPCSTGGCEGTSKGLCVKQPPRRLDAEKSSKSNYTARATLAKKFRNKKMSVQASFNVK